jgi:hypothetical protein
MDRPTNRPSNPMGFFKDARETPADIAPEVEAYRQKWIARDRQAAKLLDAMSERNPARIVGELVYARVQDTVNERLGRMLRRRDRAKGCEWDRER